MTTKSTFSVGFIAQKGKPKNDGTVPILARIIINGEMAHFSTKFYVLPSRWMTREGRTVGSTHDEKATYTPATYRPGLPHQNGIGRADEKADALGPLGKSS